jgi:hypothetical protein
MVKKRDRDRWDRSHLGQAQDGTGPPDFYSPVWFSECGPLR